MRLWPGRTEPEGVLAVRCVYCGWEGDREGFYAHQNMEDHRGLRRLWYVAPVVRPENPQDEVLRQNLENLGDPGGSSMGRFLQARDGFLLCHDEVKNITSFVYTIINPACTTSVPRRICENKLRDALLPLNCIVPARQWKRKDCVPEGFELGHLTPWIYHQHNDNEKASSLLVSNFCVQTVALNKGPLIDLERQGRSVCLLLKTHCITGTILMDDDPVLVGHPFPTPIPDAIYKIHAFEINPTTVYYDAYYLPNSPEIERDPEVSRCSIELINKLSGFNFLSNKKVNFFTKTDKVDLPKILVTLTKEKDITPLMNALKAKDEESKKRDAELEVKDQELQALRIQLRTIDAQAKRPPTKKARKTLEDE